MAEAEDGPIGDKPTITETQWQAAAIATALLTIVLGIASSLWVLGWVPSQPISTEEMAARGRAVTPIGAFLIAIITFCTVAWRAKVTERQADTQQRQLASADENNLATLLQKGAELLDEEKEGKVAAGIATLEAVALAENDRFATQALNLLAKHIESAYDDHTHHLFGLVSEVLTNASRKGRNKTIYMRFINTNENKDNWNFIEGINDVSYYGGSFNGMFGENTPYNNNAIYRACIFEFFYLNEIPTRAAGCEFNYCQIARITNRDVRNVFKSCNFSGTGFEFDNSKLLDLVDAIEGNSNYYFSENPPEFSDNQVAAAILPLLDNRREKGEL